MMLSILNVLGPHEFRLRISLGAQAGSPISSGRKDFTVGSDVLPRLRVGLEIELSDSAAENVMQNGDFLRQVVEIMIARIPPVHEVRFVYLLVPLGRSLLQGSGSTNLFD
jgi:hypothetical protein